MKRIPLIIPKIDIDLTLFDPTQTSPSSRKLDQGHSPPPIPHSAVRNGVYSFHPSGERGSLALRSPTAARLSLNGSPRARSSLLIGTIVFLFLTFSHVLYAQDESRTFQKGRDREPTGMPPAKVVVGEISTGTVSPQMEFVGTIYYKEVSDVASEVDGSVGEVYFEEGELVKKGSTLVKLSSDVLEKTILSTMASYEQTLVDLEKARRDLQRVEGLYKEGLVAEQAYDEHRFRVKGLEKKAISLKAGVERLEVELKKKIVKAPYDGVVIKRHVEMGEWLSPGSPVATLARYDIVDVVVDVPEGVIGFVSSVREVKVKAGGGEFVGRVSTVIPKGDVSTRTFPIKIRLRNPGPLKEGMEARVRLPVGEGIKTLMVPRDAVITMFGRTVIFVVLDSKAKITPVNVAGYEGVKAGIQGEGLKEGMKVVIKGHERLRDGQSVVITKWIWMLLNSQ